MSGTENKTLVAFERMCGVGPTRAARVLGVAYPTYAQYRSGRRELPLYHHLHIAALKLLSKEALNATVKERV